jgi:hypothetical protein
MNQPTTPKSPTDETPKPALQRPPLPGPVDTAHESVAGEEDPGAGVEDEGNDAFSHLPPGLDHPG